MPNGSTLSQILRRLWYYNSWTGVLEKEIGRILDHVTRNTSMYERGSGGEKYTRYFFGETASQQIQF